ncbi:hypothetical protein OLMES_5327 [Oleiphilus messinensis]|uniref:Uncharacterized protein n=1 Tax=Oleiphilus messinensis TaxID=141451 RepID=A0A1Y0IFK6_9GAMM|nr:NACHT domain-containing protein [Oleiphilus messinensis]ARU59307.1 hypothetical protein OLMES_5327 [Oleiphilus messinensis]
MNSIDFYNIKVHGESKQSSFEDLCMHFFCRELKVSSIDSYQNQPGIETEPVSINGELIGFQVKYFQGKFDWEQIQHSLLGAENKSTKSRRFDLRFPDNVFKKYGLTKVYIYSNKEKTLNRRDKTKAELLINKVASKYGCTTTFVCEKALVQKLIMPTNKDLSQLYFGVGDELGVIKRTISSELQTFLSSSEYLPIPITDQTGKKISDLSRFVLVGSTNTYILSGSPGSGKSILARKLFQELGGLDLELDKERIQLFTTNKVIPVLINLKDCAFETVDYLVGKVKSELGLDNSTLHYCYLFDGLDEVSEERLDSVLSFLKKLSATETKSRIVITCRKGNTNLRRLRSYFSSINTMSIEDLSSAEIEAYFKGKMDCKKIDHLKALSVNNSSLLSEVKDILLAELLWQTIETLGEHSNSIDLIRKKVDLLLGSPQHIKSLNKLNLLNPKKGQILELLQRISFEYHDKRKNKFQFRFYIAELQHLVQDLLPKLDYRSVNEIISYISDLFFDTTPVASEGMSDTYIFRHRRYQEFFFAQKLKKEYEKDPAIVRQLKVISSRDFFEDLFLVYVRNEYLNEGNILGLTDLNLIDVYLGKNDKFGVDDNDFFSSSEFLGCLLAQSDEVYDEILGDRDLAIESRLLIDVESARALTRELKSGGHSELDLLEDQFKFLWESEVSELLNNISLFWKAGRKEFSSRLKKNLSDIDQLVRESGVLKELSSDINDPYRDQFENFIFLKIVIQETSPIEILEKLVRPTYTDFEEEPFYSYQESGKDKLINSFIRVIIEFCRSDILEIFDTFDHDEKSYLFPELLEVEGLELLYSNEKLFDKIKQFISEFGGENSRFNLNIIGLKKLFGLDINETELEQTRKIWEDVRNERPMDWHFRGTSKKHLISSYILEKFKFDDYLKPQERHSFRYFNEKGLYAALYEGVIRIISKKDKPEEVLGQFVKYINYYYEGRSSYLYLTNEITKLVATIFSKGEDSEALKPFLTIFNRFEGNLFNPFLFYLSIHKNSPERFNSIVARDDLRQVEEGLAVWGGEYGEFVDTCFSTSRMLAKLDPVTSKKYLYMGVNDGALRHGWRKDSLVSVSLVQSLETIWEISATTSDRLLDYTTKVFELTRKVVDITDGKGTVQGPSNVLAVISKYDPKHTEYLYDQIEGYSWEKNIALAAVINSKIRFGYELKEIYTNFDSFQKHASYSGHIDPDYYDQQFECLINIASSYLYTDAEKRDAFERCSELISKASEDNTGRFLGENEFKELKRVYDSLCLSYDLETRFNVSFAENIETSQGFIERIKIAEDRAQISNLYVELRDYERRITLKERKDWEILIRKTKEICGDIDLFINLLRESYYPHSDWYFHQSRYLHLGLSVALTDIDSKEIILLYLKDNTGHGGFSNLIKSYAAHNDRDMCCRLFNRYLQLCNLLVK